MDIYKVLENCLFRSNAFESVKFNQLLDIVDLDKYTYSLTSYLEGDILIIHIHVSSNHFFKKLYYSTYRLDNVSEYIHTSQIEDFTSVLKMYIRNRNINKL